ncbi:MAG: WbqC family protein [Aequorivita sp.]|nr:WbqC family protein [Aequorivita sp.]
MKTILLHPSYFPSIEQMSAVAQAEKVVFEVEDNYQKQTYRNRTFIAHSNGRLLLNIPIKHNKTGKRQKTKNVVIENDFPWQEHHWRSLQSAYRTSPFFEYYEDDLEGFFTKPVESLMEHNLKIFDLICELLGKELKVSKTTSYEKNPEITDLRILVDAKRKSNFEVEVYTQVHEANHPFLANLSVLDLLFNEGPNALSYLERAPLPSRVLGGFTNQR